MNYKLSNDYMSGIYEQGLRGIWEGKRMKKLYALILTLVLVISLLSVKPADADAYTVPSNMQWWEDAGFGMFIHFGSFSYY